VNRHKNDTEFLMEVLKRIWEIGWEEEEVRHE
jgi:hypothetical protein